MSAANKTGRKAVPSAKKASKTAKSAGTTGVSPRPSLGPAVAIRTPSVSDRVLPGGLRVAAVRRKGVPLVELRLRIPFAGTAKAHLARRSVLDETFFAGTASHDAPSLARAIQALGGGLSAGSDADRLAVSGSALAPNLRPMLDLLAEILTSNTYPADEVEGEAERIAEEIAIARTTPSSLAGEVVSRRIFGRHPYGRDLPTVEEVRAVTSAGLKSLHSQQVSPVGALLVIVGDVVPVKALDAAEAALSSWSNAGRKPVTLPPVPAFTPGGMSLLDRPGSVQTSLRLVGAAPRRAAPDYPALALANTVFAGYFSSRLVANIREDKGYTYSPHGLIQHADLASLLTVEADVATDVTAPALVETNYELAKIASGPVTQDELDDARRYLVGTQALGMSSQAGLAGSLTALLDSGLDASWLRTFPAALAKVTVDDAFAAAQKWLAPAAMATVLVGDRSVIGPGLQTLGPIHLITLDG